MSSSAVDATRQVLWNSGSSGLLYAGSALAVLAFLGGLAIAILSWRRGYKDIPGPRVAIRTALWSSLSNKGLVCDKKHLRIHRLIFWGTMVLFAGTVLEAANTRLGWGILVGPLYLTFKLVLDLAGASVLIGIAQVVDERWIHRLKRLESHFRDVLPLALLGLAVLSGFMVEGARLAATADRWGIFSPVGSLFALVWGALDVGQTTVLHRVLWYSHVIVALGLIAVTPWSKLLHVIATPLTVLTARPFPVRGMPRSIRRAERAGDTPVCADPATLSGWTHRQLLELDACMQCGRCRTWCSIRHAGLPDSPASLMDGGRKLLHAHALTAPIVGAAISADGLWACTTCRTCEEHCPMCGEHVVRLVDLRRSEIARGRIPEHAARKFVEIEGQLATSVSAAPGAPETGAAAVAILAPSEGNLVHIWPGCHAALEDAEVGDGIMAALCSLICLAGLVPVVMTPPACCGFPARRLGNEDLYLRSAEANLSYLETVAPALIVTPCPHCYETLRQEYAELGAHIQVVHHARFLSELIGAGKLAPAARPGARFVYHDPCYLSRYGGDVTAAREVLRAIPGVELDEVRRHNQRTAFCCGDGGGTVSAQVADANGRERMAQLQECAAGTVVTACPYCRDNLRRSVDEESAGQQKRIVDIAEALAGR